MNLTMKLEFIAVDQAPEEWKDGRLLLSAEKGFGHLWRVVWYRRNPLNPRSGWVYYEGENFDSLQGYEAIEAEPAFLAELPLNMEACEVKA